MHVATFMYPYSTYYKPMGDLPYISSEQGGLIIRTELIYVYTLYISVLYKNFELKRGWAYNTSWAYNTYIIRCNTVVLTELFKSMKLRLV